MRIPTGRLALFTALALTAGAADATVTLVLGTNQLQDHINGVKNTTASTTVFGTTKLENTSVSFSSSTPLFITNGFAQITDGTPGVTPFNNLTIGLTNGGGFTAYEFSIQYPSGSVTQGKKTTVTPFTALLTIGYELVGGGAGTFTYLPCSPANPTGCDVARQDLKFTNSGTQDFQLQATGNDVFSRIYLLSDQPIFQVKQNEIKLATKVGAVPEPASWAMMLVGFALVGAGYRRRPAPKRALA